MKGIVAICLIISASLSSADVLHSTEVECEQSSSPRPYAFSYTAGRFDGHIDRAHSEVSDGNGVVRGAFSYIDPRQEIRSVEYVADANGFHPILSHPQASEPQQTQAVKQATAKHLEEFDKVSRRDERAQEGEYTHYQMGAQQYEPQQTHAQIGDQAYGPQQSQAVQQATASHLEEFDKVSRRDERAKEREYELYDKIANEHYQMGAQQYQPQQRHARINEQAYGPQQTQEVKQETAKHFRLYDRIAAEHAQIGAEQHNFAPSGQCCG